MAKSKYASKIAGVLHRAAKGAVRVGAMNKTTMREFDVLCLTQVRSLSANDIKRIRTANNVSQEVFARYLNVTSTLVSQWERNEKKPSGPSLKLLNIVEDKGLDAIA
jgi:putative transcriptional regulator